MSLSLFPCSKQHPLMSVSEYSRITLASLPNSLSNTSLQKTVLEGLLSLRMGTWTGLPMISSPTGSASVRLTTEHCEGFLIRRHLNGKELIRVSSVNAGRDLRFSLPEFNLSPPKSSPL